jgi:putative heme-binding domain-containing protein
MTPTPHTTLPERTVPRLPALTAALGLALVAAPAPAQPKKDKNAPPPKREATSPDALAVAPGFKVELVHTADPAEQGSWISLSKDPKGRLIVGGQRGQAVLRVTLADGKAAKIEKLDLPFTEVMGTLSAHGSLYVMGAGPNAAYGLFRCRDTNGDDKFDDVKLMRDFKTAGEHGAHAIAAGPDGMLYVMIGNFVRGIPDPAPTSPHRNFKEDLLLPRQWDGNGHAAGVYAPGGSVVRTDPEGKTWELFCGGFRNAYDHAFNADGELFTFDSDMEWDWGMPWYRPTRVNHCVSGGDAGWRSGSGVWPDYYADSLPAVANVGIGSPTGVTFGYGAKFPAKYQKAFFISDWSYGRLFAVHLSPNGAGYTGTVEPFISPAAPTGDRRKSPLNLTDVVVGDDGAMYFTVGGRNTQAALYRVTYTGSEPTAPADAHDAVGAKRRQLRHELEAFHTKTDPKAVAFAWPHLGSPDRFIRYAARVAVEKQPVGEWHDKAFAETNPQAALTAMLAVARTGDPKQLPAVLAALGRLPLSSLSADQKLDKLRALGLAFSRMGRPPVDAARKVVADLDPAFPGGDPRLDRELSQMLIYLQAPGVAAKCLKQAAAATTVEDRMYYLFHLRTLPVGFWTLDQRKEYLGLYPKDLKEDLKALGHPPELLQWFADAKTEYGNGNSFGNFVRNIAREAAVNMSDAERKQLDPLIAAINKGAVPDYAVKPRAVVKAWTLAELAPELAKADKGRSFDKGREAYLAAQCIKCHKVGDDGGAVGPDLSAIASRFDRRALLESIVEPSKTVSDQYQNEQITTAADQVVVGRVVDETPDKIVVQSNPLAPDRTEVRRADVVERKPAKLSPMPDHLVDVLTADEVLDLIAFLEAGGKKDYKAFTK